MSAHHAATGRFETPKASQYLQQLCKHFAHKLEVQFDETSGEIALPPGPCRLAASDGVLSIDVEADSSDELARAKFIVDKHLARFAFREAFSEMEWQDNIARP